MKSLLMRKRTFAPHLALSSTDNQNKELENLLRLTMYWRSWRISETQILSQALKSLTGACKDSIINTIVETILEGKMCETVVKYFKKLKMEHKFSFLNKQLWGILDDELLEDKNFLRWLAKKLDMPKAISASGWGI